MKTFVVFKNSVGTRREICSSRCQSLFRLVFGGTDSFFLNHFELKRPQSQHWLWVHSLLRFHFNAYQLSVSLLHNCFTEINALQSLMGFTAFLFLIFHQLYHGLRWRWKKKNSRGESKRHFCGVNAGWKRHRWFPDVPSTMSFDFSDN